MKIEYCPDDCNYRDKRIRYLSGADEEKEDTHGEEKDDAAEERDKGGDGTAAIYEDPSDDEGNGFSF